ncbi:hypothetical protein GGX14DRAFT_578646 [Mycena pura]|uniref:Uncharacterized protein n=1 Tax=Mycena pura TaxID=153505 RepID=A0AAD6UT54_9AGAR|nr:hypothetical protein GGX14DRAFT_578646 [Mycena pura]
MAAARPRSTPSCFDRRHIVPHALVAAVPAPIAAALFAVVNDHGQRLATSHVPAPLVNTYDIFVWLCFVTPFLIMEPSKIEM